MSSIDIKVHYVSDCGEWVTYTGKRSQQRKNRLTWSRKKMRFAESKSDTASPKFINEVLRREGVSNV